MNDKKILVNVVCDEGLTLGNDLWTLSYTIRNGLLICLPSKSSCLSVLIYWNKIVLLQIKFALTLKFVEHSCFFSVLFSIFNSSLDLRLVTVRSKLPMHWNLQNCQLNEPLFLWSPQISGQMHEHALPRFWIPKDWIVLHRVL